LARGRTVLGTLDGARGDALVLLEAALQRSAAWVLAHGDETPPPEALARYESYLARRRQGEPVAYILGVAGFYGRTFAVGPEVLVPRPETEELLERALVALRAWPPERPATVCDVGTGSGVLAISLALEVPRASILAVDVSAAALETARRNARQHAVDARVRFVCADALEAAGDGERFACITANLPYLRSAEIAAAPDPTSFEPRVALDGGPDGLSAYRRLLGRAPLLLATGGTLLMEAGPATAGPLAREAARAFGERARASVHRDYGGRERIVEVVA
jgi:release factor glutamine methyltransferase